VDLTNEQSITLTASYFTTVATIVFHTTWVATWDKIKLASFSRPNHAVTTLAE